VFFNFFCPVKSSRVEVKLSFVDFLVGFIYLGMFRLR